MLIDFSTPASSYAVAAISGAEALQDPFSPLKSTTFANQVTKDTGSEQEHQSVATEEEGEELRKAKKQAILDQRAARRKSMANRRVSFAPEATLHTWNVIEMVEDSTTSSTTNSTKRQSSIAAANTPEEVKQNNVPGSDPSEPPSTPPEQVDEPLVKASPAHQRDLHQKSRRRRSSGAPDAPQHGTNRAEVSPTSSYSGSSAMGDSSPLRVEDSIHSSSDEDGDTAMSMEDATVQTVQSEISSSSTGSSLDDRLRRAAAEAGTRGIAYDENGDDLAMELADGTVTSVFQPWVGNHSGSPKGNDVIVMDEKSVNSVSPVVRSATVEAEDGDQGAASDESSEDLSMELADGTITTAFQPWVNGDIQASAKGVHDIEVQEVIKDDENGDDSAMELADGTVTTAFQPWVNGQAEVQSKPQVPAQDVVVVKDQENTRSTQIDGDLSMELVQTTMTSAFQSWMDVEPKSSAEDLSTIQSEEHTRSTEIVDDLPMDIAQTTITKAFQTWIQRNPQMLAQDNSPMKDKENINPLQADTRFQDDADDADDADNVFKAVDVSVTPQKQERKVEKIPLQDFLKMTNIHFMELSTTKRRHTMAPVPAAQQSEKTLLTSSAACFAAAATTLPLLELYQHATRELKTYISTGRKVIRSIEQDTLDEQPALFQEYVDARPDVKLVMDNQFRNGKANARLQSKEGWYAWRRQLVEGLRGGLDGIKAGMEEDARSLTGHEKILQDTVPPLVDHFGQLEQEARMLQQRAEEYDNIDHQSLKNSRGQLESVEQEVAQKMVLLGELQQQMADKAEALSTADELRAEFQAQIAEAERVQDECRGWKAEDVRSLQEKVKAIERKTGWTLITAEHEVEDGDTDFGPALTMRYRDALRLFFYPAAFHQKSSEQSGRRRSRRSQSNSCPSAPVSLTFSPLPDSTGMSSLTTPQRFFLQLLQGQLHALAALPRGTVSANTLLMLVCNGWDVAVAVSEEIRMLEIAGITTVSILSDDKLGVKCMLILPVQCRVDVQFTLIAHATNEGSVSINVMVEAAPKYGSITALLKGSKASKICEALNKQASSKTLGEGAWISAVRGLEDWVNLQKEAKKEPRETKKPAPNTTSEPAPLSSVPQVTTPTPAPITQKKELKKPVPMEEVMEEAAARRQEHRRQEEAGEGMEEILMSATKTPGGHGRRPGALRRSP